MRKVIRRTITKCQMQHSFFLTIYVVKLKASTFHPCDSLTSLLETVIQVPEPGEHLAHIAWPCFLNLITREGLENISPKWRGKSHLDQPCLAACIMTHP